MGVQSFLGFYSIRGYILSLEDFNFFNIYN